MSTDQAVLLESATMRARHGGRVEALDKVKALALLPDGVHVTTAMVANYFEVEFATIRRVVVRNRTELTSNGMQVLRGEPLRQFVSDNMSLSNSEGYPQAYSSLTLFSRRAVLNVAMLLRDSDIARCVRAYLLDAEDLAYIDVRIDARLKWHTKVIGALSVKVTNIDCKVDAIQDTLAGMRQELSELRVDRGLRIVPPQRE